MSPYSVLPTLYGDTHYTANWRNVAVAIQCMSLISVYTVWRLDRVLLHVIFSKMKMLILVIACLMLQIAQ